MLWLAVLWSLCCMKCSSCLILSTSFLSCLVQMYLYTAAIKSVSSVNGFCDLCLMFLFSLSLCLSVCLSVCLYVSLSLSLSFSVCLSLFLSLSVCLSVCLSLCEYQCTRKQKKKKPLNKQTKKWQQREGKKSVCLSHLWSCFPYPWSFFFTTLEVFCFLPWKFYAGSLADKGLLVRHNQVVFHPSHTLERGIFQLSVSVWLKHVIKVLGKSLMHSAYSFRSLPNGAVK